MLRARSPPSPPLPSPSLPVCPEQLFADACEQCAHHHAGLCSGTRADSVCIPRSFTGGPTQALPNNGDGHTHRAMVHGLCRSRQAHVKAQQSCPMLRYPWLGCSRGCGCLHIPRIHDPPFPRLLGEVKAWRTWLAGGLGEEHMGLTAFPSLLCYGFDRSSVIRLNTQCLPRLTIC